jgi:hypothetical protein
MLGFTVSQATISSYMPARSRRPTQSWRTFLRNQTIAFGQYFEERSDRYARPYVASYSADLMQFRDAQTAAGQQQRTLNTERVNLRSSRHDRGVTNAGPHATALRSVGSTKRTLPSGTKATEPLRLGLLADDNTLRFSAAFSANLVRFSLGVKK